MSLAGTVLLVAVAVLGGAGVVLWSRRMERAGRLIAGLALIAVASAFVLLEVALLTRDTSIRYVGKVIDESMPVLYRFSSLWSATEGSLLLWLACLTTVTTVFITVTARRLGPTRFTAAAVLCGLQAVFGMVVLLGSPFAPTDAGTPPSPLLQDHPAMSVHPPLLYAGFTALAVPFALSCAALATGSTDAHWAGALRRWASAAWIPLTAGVLLGAWWSYAVLGWGGYWAWDPVENASLLPWLAATALLHVVGRRMRTSGWQRWSVILAALSFLLVLLATFLTRSGVISSIHAFSTAPLGVVLLLVLVTATVAWLVLAALRMRHLPRGAPTPLFSRQGALTLNRALLLLVTAIVLVGSVLPAVLLATTGARTAVGAPWYTRTLSPLALALLLAMAVGPWLSWRADTLSALARRLALPAAVGAVVAGAVGLLVRDPWLAVVGGISAFTLVTLGMRLAARRSLRSVGAFVAHFGLTLAAIAVLAGNHAVVAERTLAVGESLAAGATTATLVDVQAHDDGRRTIVEARTLITGNDGGQWEAHPQLRWYEQHQTTLAGPEIRTDLLRDTYLTLLDVDAQARTATVRLTVTPLVAWLWGGGLLMVLGAALSLAAPPKRPSRQRIEVAATALVETGGGRSS